MEVERSIMIDGRDSTMELEKTDGGAMIPERERDRRWRRLCDEDGEDSVTRMEKSV